MTDQCFCKSYTDDEGIVQDCICGKCARSDGTPVECFSRKTHPTGTMTNLTLDNWREHIIEILGLETDRDGDLVLFIRDEDENITDGIPMEKDVDTIVGLINNALESQKAEAVRRIEKEMEEDQCCNNCPLGVRLIDIIRSL